MRKNLRAFTLIEMIAAMTVAGVCALACVGFLIWGMKNARDEKIYSISALISENLRAKLYSNYDWPMPQTQAIPYTNKIFQTNFYYTFEGLETTPQEAVFQVQMNFVEPSESDEARRLDFIFADFYEMKEKRFIGRHYFQRAHPQPRNI